MSPNYPAAWQQILSQSNISLTALLKQLALTIDDFDDLACQPEWPIRIPAPFLARIRPEDPHDPLLRQVLSSQQEAVLKPGYQSDPLQESSCSPIPGILHKYQNRILLTMHGACAIHCRYCFRRHYPYHEQQAEQKNWDQIQDYLQKNPAIDEIILSGGDPLICTNQSLKKWLMPMDACSQIKSIRIHSRVPIVLPQRIDTPLLQLFAAMSTPITLVIHCNHAQEIDDIVCHQLLQLKKSVHLLLNQSVLLAEVNDCSDTLIALSWRLHQSGVLPYYLHQLDRVQGAHHFEVSDKRACEIMRDVACRLPGFLVPKLARELPGIPYKQLINW